MNFGIFFAICEYTCYSAFITELNHLPVRPSHNNGVHSWPPSQADTYMVVDCCTDSWMDDPQVIRNDRTSHNKHRQNNAAVGHTRTQVNLLVLTRLS